MLREPTVGPIVGHTTSNSCRIWIRGAGTGDKRSTLSEDRRSVGVISIIQKNGRAVPRNQRRAAYFRLHREFDRTGTFDLGSEHSFKVDHADDPTLRAQPLDPNTTYTVRVGSLTIDDAHDNDAMVESLDLADRLPHPNAWLDDLDRLDPTRSVAEFRTFGVEPSNKLRFLLGSCRYPGPFWKKKRSDQIFRPMYQACVPADEEAARFVLMVGDQIYADQLNRMIAIGRADTYEEFQERYLTAFGSPNMSRLLRSVPNYMILDDHEIEDNWSQDRIRKQHELFNLAIDAYRSYQWSHCPRTFGEHLYYQFECDGYPFFVLDGRTQRFKGNNLDRNHLFGRDSFPEDPPSQLETLCSWLVDMQKARGNVPKFIVTGSVFAPNNLETVEDEAAKLANDSWPAFPNTRKQLLETIVEHEIQNVVFLSGDIHNSNVAEIEFSGNESVEALKAFSITSSAFYWPFPFADGDPSHYVHDSRNERTPDSFSLSNGVQMDYTASNFTQEDNFCIVELDQDNHQLTVQVKDKRGRSVRAHGGQDLTKQLSLEPW